MRLHCTVPALLAIVFLASRGMDAAAIASAFVALCLVVSMFGFFMVDPNEARVLQLFGAYVGTARDAGLRWANPFYTKRKVSVRIRNFESGAISRTAFVPSPVSLAAFKKEW